MFFKLKFKDCNGVEILNKFKILICVFINSCPVESGVGGPRNPWFRYVEVRVAHLGFPNRVKFKCVHPLGTWEVTFHLTIQRFAA